MHKYATYKDKDCWHFRFSKGEGLELHEHIPDNYHDTLMIKGSCLIAGPGWEKVISEGDLYTFTDPEMHHQITALNDVEFLNIYRNPMPQIREYKEWM